MVLESKTTRLKTSGAGGGRRKSKRLTRLVSGTINSEKTYKDNNLSVPSSRSQPNNNNATGSSSFPSENGTYSLLLTLPHKVLVWTSDLLVPIFTSFSEGIVATSRARDGSALAVADSQVVVLHRVEEGQTHSYRLKGSETSSGRRLHYAHDSKQLFYTEGLSCSVLMYALREGSVREVGVPHPSPVTTFAVSVDSNLILSASADPPVCHLHNRTMASTVSVVSKASEKSVIACAFHPSRKNVFLLAFNDGVVAAYDSTRMFPKNQAAAAKVGYGHGQGPPVYAEHIHKFAHLHDPSVAGSAGLTGIQFVPGHRARAITVGEDGRLFIVDFEKRDVLASWHVGAPINCLSVRETGEGDGKSWLAAVGTVHGMVYIYDAEGTRVCEQMLDQEGGKVLDVEWVSGEVKLPRETGLGRAGQTVVVHDVDLGRDVKPLETSRGGANVEKAPAKNGKGKEKGKEEPKQIATAVVVPEMPEVAELMYTKDYMSIFSPVKKAPARKANSDAADGKNDKKPSSSKEVKASPSKRSVVSAPQTWDEKSPVSSRKPSAPTNADPSPAKKSTALSSIMPDPALKLFADSAFKNTTFDPHSSSSTLPPIPIPLSTGNSFHLPIAATSTHTATGTNAGGSGGMDTSTLLHEIRAIRGDSRKPSSTQDLESSTISLFGATTSKAGNPNPSLLMDEMVRSGLRRGAGRAKRPAGAKFGGKKAAEAGKEGSSDIETQGGETRRQSLKRRQAMVEDASENTAAESSERTSSNASKKSKKSVQWAPPSAEESFEESLMAQMMDTLDGNTSHMVTSTPHNGGNGEVARAHFALPDAPSATLTPPSPRSQFRPPTPGNLHPPTLTIPQQLPQQPSNPLTPRTLTTLLAPTLATQSSNLASDLESALSTLREGVKDDLRSFSIDMLKQFQLLRRGLEEVKVECKELRKENEELRTLLSRESGSGGIGLGLGLGGFDFGSTVTTGGGNGGSIAGAAKSAVTTAAVSTIGTALSTGSKPSKLGFAKELGKAAFSSSPYIDHHRDSHHQTASSRRGSPADMGFSLSPEAGRGTAAMVSFTPAKNGKNWKDGKGRKKSAGGWSVGSGLFEGLDGEGSGEDGGEGEGREGSETEEEGEGEGGTDMIAFGL